MPGQSWDESGPRFQAASAVTLFVPVVTILLIQLPATIGISVWMRVPPRGAALSTALAAASALALLAARRWRAAVAVVAALTLADLFVPPDMSPPFIALAFAIIGASGAARLWALISVGIAWLIAIAAIGFIDTGVHPFRIAITSIGLAACFAIGEAMRLRLDRDAQRHAQLQERRRITEQDERTRMARELHDVLAHSLSQIAVQSGVGLHLFDKEPERARGAGQHPGAERHGARRGAACCPSCAAMRPPRARHRSLRSLSRPRPLAVQRTGLGLDVTLEDRLDGRLPPSAVQTTAYRSAGGPHERRPPLGRCAHVTLDREADDRGDVLVVTVEDDGTGLASGRSEGAGIRGMRERAELAGGELTLFPADRAGTIVTARLPWAGAS